MTAADLPDGRSYPAIDEELGRLMAGYAAVQAVLAENSAGALLITHGWQQHAPNGRPDRDEFIASLTPSATWWRTDDHGPAQRWARDPFQRPGVARSTAPVGLHR
ncbi:hypothetical protein [Nakamurella sp.]|uniref:hypothetical protein n=1 Tax=Nakamurella sp. TaxID=1869182 RepID=UPI003B3A34FC